MLLHADDLGLNGHYFRGERIIIFTIVKLRWILQVNLEDETLLFLVCHPLIKYAEVENGDEAIRVVHMHSISRHSFWLTNSKSLFGIS